MYIPSSFAETDPSTLHDFMRRHSFATLVTQGDPGLTASHLPLLWDPTVGPNGALLGHMARANPQWRDVPGEALAIFQGPHAYISPTWYETEGTVPTWNYVAVHASGAFQIVDDDSELLGILRRSVNVYEADRNPPWTFDESAPNIGPMLRSIVGFRIEISRLEGKFKLSQNHPQERRERVIRGLSSEPDEAAREVAELMARRDSPGR